jgi:tRNA-specific 2-thiouridylase
MRPNPFEDHLTDPRGRGPAPAGAACGSAGGAACGDLVRISVRAGGGRIAEATFDAEGCGAAVAAGSACVTLVEGAPLLEAARTGPAEISRELGGLSPGKLHAADLAADALHRALAGLWAAPRGGDADSLLEPRPGRVLVAMSGGVDSAAAALLEQRAEREVVAVTLKLWDDPVTDGTRACCSPQAVVGARALAHSMGLPHLTLDLREGFRAAVVDDFIAEHDRGRTPNPCVRCNGSVRFDAMLELAERIGAEALSTGHYARIERDADGPLLARAADADKDQAYMLAALRPGLLERVRFPLGGLTKPEVREIARAAGLPVADRRESQDLCFLAGTDRERFLARHGGLADRDGEVVDAAGRVLGRHRGHRRFTVGQRRGLGVSAGTPLYVISKDAGSNRVVVGAREDLAGREVRLEPAVLHRDGARVDRVKLRYRSGPAPCRVAGNAAAGPRPALVLQLEDDAFGVAAGQTACLMDGDRVVGYGTIAASELVSESPAHP